MAPAQKPMFVSQKPNTAEVRHRARGRDGAGARRGLLPVLLALPDPVGGHEARGAALRVRGGAGAERSRRGGTGSIGAPRGRRGNGALITVLIAILCNKCLVALLNVVEFRHAKIELPRSLYSVR